MGKQLDELAKALASGTSRRVALKRFAAGLTGAVLANVFAGQTAQAADSIELGLCRAVCADLRNGPPREYARCLRFCAECIIHGGTPIDVNNGFVCTNGG